MCEWEEDKGEIKKLIWDEMYPKLRIEIELNLIRSR